MNDDAAKHGRLVCAFTIYNRSGSDLVITHEQAHLLYGDLKKALRIDTRKPRRLRKAKAAK